MMTAPRNELQAARLELRALDAVLDHYPEGRLTDGQVERIGNLVMRAQALAFDVRKLVMDIEANGEKEW